MNHLVLRSNTSMPIGDKSMVLLPLNIYEKITKSLGKLNSKILQKSGEKVDVVFLTSASESSLSKDWLSPVEEKTWKNL